MNAHGIVSFSDTIRVPSPTDSSSRLAIKRKKSWLVINDHIYGDFDVSISPFVGGYSLRHLLMHRFIVGGLKN